MGGVEQRYDYTALDNIPALPTPSDIGAATAADLTAETTRATNAETGILANFADEYASGNQYSVGDYATHDGALYRNIVAITSPEAWTAEHWELVSVGDELADISDSVEEAYNELDTAKQDVLTFDDSPTADSDNPVTSGGIYDALLDKAPVIVDSASGSIASFSDGIAAPFEAMSFTVEPVQDLHGYDAPYPAGGGKNLLKNTGTTATSRGITATFNADGTVTLSGTNDGTGYSSFTINTAFPTENGVEYILSGAISANILLRDTTAAVSDVGSGIAIIGDGTSHQIFLRVLANAAVSGTAVVKPMIRLSTVSDATFAPYENICPISGWNSATVTGAGVNVWDEQWEVGSINNTTGQDSSDSTNIRGKNYISVKPNTGYYFYIGVAKSLRIYWYDREYGFLSSETARNAVKTAPNDAYYLRVRTTSEYGDTYNNDISINYPSTDTAYHASSVRSLTLNFPSTVYGGTAVWNGDDTWTVTVDMATVTVDPNDVTSNGGLPYGGRQIKYNPTPTKATPKTNTEGLMCNFFEVSATDAENVVHGRTTDDAILFDMPADVTTLALAKTWFTNNPTQVSYLIAEPTTFTVTTEELFNALKGENNIWSSTGDTTLEYCADTKSYIDRKILEAITNALNA